MVRELKPYFEKTTQPLISKLHELKVQPNHITLAGLLFILLGSYFLYEEQDLMALVFLTLGALSDALDGALARKSKGGSTFGAFFDSVVDRFSDAMPFIALALRYEGATALGSLLALVFSFGVSYTRARAEGLGYELRVGIFERPERWTVLLLSILIGYPQVGVWVVFIGSLITTLQRVYTFRKLTQGG